LSPPLPTGVPGAPNRAKTAPISTGVKIAHSMPLHQVLNEAGKASIAKGAHHGVIMEASWTTTRFYTVS
jgi:hypothetical protein